MADTSKHPWSVTSGELRGQLQRELERDARSVVVTVADVEGSAYRRPGAKMLVGDDGTPAGAVTAGCLEEPITELSMAVLDAGEPRRETFDLLEDDDDTWGIGIGCNGLIDVLVEPLDASWRAPLDHLEAGTPVTVLTVIDSTIPDLPVGARAYVGEDGSARAVADREPVPEAVLDGVDPTVSSVRGRERAATVDVETERGTASVLVDGLKPVPKLLLVGSQPDIHPVARVGSDAGFEVIVHSPRGARGPAAFPNADRVETGHPSTVGESVGTPASTYAVVMTHNLVDDRIAVETLLSETTVPYVGLMGPRDRFDRLRDDADAIAGEELDRLATPVGLDLGGGEPIEIALSIVSEALAVSNGRDGTRLKRREGPIHGRLGTERT
jgi:xanthine dehydrogenase accessory factor